MIRNLMKKSTYALSVLLALASQAHAANPSALSKKSDSPAVFRQGLDSCEKTYSRAYNAPARDNAKNSWVDGWDLDVYGSFIYWHTSQELMDVATENAIANENPVEVLYQPFNYKPGFKIGLGLDLPYDDWSLFAEYTWLHQSTNQTAVASPTTYWYGVNWLTAAVDSTYHPVYLSSTWKMHLDQVDLAVTRPYYQGSSLTVSPFAGLRGLWINEAFSVTLDPSAVPNNASSVTRSHCWSVGPVAGMYTDWLLGTGFRVEGMASTSLLYTSYTKLANKLFVSSVAAAAATPTSYALSTSNYDALRPTLGLGLGLGWGSYWDADKWYTDLSLRYDFAQLWNQNMIRYWSSSSQNVSLEPGALQMHGLTATFRLDF